LGIYFLATNLPIYFIRVLNTILKEYYDKLIACTILTTI
jgi:hypothetical protein